MNWAYGTLITPKTPDAPPSVGEDDSVAALLDEAEDIINRAGDSIREDVDEEREREAKRARKRRWWPF